MMSRFWEYDEEAHRQAMYDEGYDDGYDFGRAEEHKLTIEERERADKAESRASMLEQELEKERKKLQMLEQKLRETDRK